MSSTLQEIKKIAVFQRETRRSQRHLNTKALSKISSREGRLILFFRAWHNRSAKRPSSQTQSGCNGSLSGWLNIALQPEVYAPYTWGKTL